MAAIVAMALTSGAAQATVLTPVKVVAGRVNQYWPSSNGAYVAWTTETRQGRSTFARELPTGETKQINPAGTQGMEATFVGASNRVVYTQRRGGHWDVYFYDISSGARWKAPARVDRAKTDEWAPMASKHYILFWRQKYSRSGQLLFGGLLLYDRTTKTMRTLATGPKYYFPGFAGDTYVAWSTCGLQRSFPVCHAFYWSKSSGTMKLAQPDGKHQYAPAIDEASSTIYFVRAASHACGKAVTIRRADLGSDSSTVLASLPAGIDTDYEQSVARNPTSGHRDLYFDRYRCNAGSGDIYALPRVDTIA